MANYQIFKFTRQSVAAAGYELELRDEFESRLNADETGYEDVFVGTAGYAVRREKGEVVEAIYLGDVCPHDGVVTNDARCGGDKWQYLTVELGHLVDHMVG